MNPPPQVFKQSAWRSKFNSFWDGTLQSFTPQTPFKSKTIYLFGFLLTLLTVTLFDSLFFNRYYPLAEGWFSVYAHFMEKGYMPYRDFHLFLTPCYQLIICLFTHYFGYSMFDLRVMGLVLNIVLTGFVYNLFAQFFEVPIAFLCSIFAVLYYQSSVVFINYDFLHFMTVFTLAGCALLCSHYRAIQQTQSTENDVFPWRIIVAGCLAGLAFLTKQSNGFFVAIFLALAAVVSEISVDRWRPFRAFFYYVLGILIPMAATWGWLEYQDLWGSFIEDTMRGGTASKGGISAILFAWIPRLFTEGRVKGLWSFCLVLILLYVEGTWRTRKFAVMSLEQSKFRSASMLWIGFVLSVVCVFCPYEWISGSREILNYSYFAEISSVLTLLGALFAAIVPLGSLYNRATGRPISGPLLIVGFTSLGLLIGNGTSAAIDVAGAFLPAALLFGYVLASPLPARWTKTGLVMLCGAFLFYLSSEKYVTPYLWWGLSQSDVRRTAPIEGIPELKGLNASMADGGTVFRDVVRLIDRYSSPSESLFTFPHMAQFHMLTGRSPDTFAAVHWFDVASDEVAVHDAQVLKISPPKVIVFLDIPSAIWVAHEKGFRNGLPSGQREIRQVLGRMIDQGRYSLVFKRWVPQNNILTVWVRRDPVPILKPLGESHG